MKVNRKNSLIFKRIEAWLSSELPFETSRRKHFHKAVREIRFEARIMLFQTSPTWIAENRLDIHGYLSFQRRNRRKRQQILLRAPFFRERYGHDGSQSSMELMPLKAGSTSSSPWKGKRGKGKYQREVKGFRHLSSR